MHVVDFKTVSDLIFVFCSFVLQMYIWPRLMFSNYLNGKSIFIKIFFCFCSAIIIIFLLVLILGYLNILDQGIFRLCIYLMMAWSIFKCLYNKRLNLQQKKIITQIKQYIKEHINLQNIISIILDIILVVCVVIMIINCVRANMITQQFSFSDESIHYDWVNSLCSGQLFPGGVYPIAMHAVVYSLNSVFFVNSYTCMLYMPCISVLLLMLAVYYFLKNILTYKLSAILAVVAVTIWFNCGVINNLTDGFVFSGMRRLSHALPQEFGLFTVFVAGMCLLEIIKRYVVNDCKIKFDLCCKRNVKFSNCVLSLFSVITGDDFIVLFIISIVEAIFIHFYLLIFQFILCLSIFIFSLYKIIKQKRFLLIFVICFTAIALGVLPYLISFVFYKPSYAISWSADYATGNMSNIFVNRMANLIDSQHILDPIFQNTELNIFEICLLRLKALLVNSINVALFPHGWSLIFYIILSVSIVIYILHILFLKIQKNSIFNCLNPNYMILIISLLFLLLLFGFPMLGFIVLLEGYRLVVMLYIVTIPLLCVPIDWTLSITRSKINNNFVRCLYVK